jgi:hypothetical protein
MTPKEIPCARPQRAMVVANIATLPKHLHKPKDTDGPIGPSTPTTEEACKRLNVSPTSAKRVGNQPVWRMLRERDATGKGG